MINDIVHFIASPFFQVPLQFFLNYTFYRLGQQKEHIRAKHHFNLLSARVDAVATVLAIKDAHIAALTAQLEETRSAK